MKRLAKYAWLLAALALIPILFRRYRGDQQPQSKWSVGEFKLGVSQSAAGPALADHVSRTIPIHDNHYFTTVCHASGTCVAFTDGAAVSVVGHSLESDGDVLLRQGDHRDLILERLGQPDTTDEDVLTYYLDEEVRLVLFDEQLKWIQLGVVPNELGNLHWMAHHYFASQEVSDTRFDPEGPQLIIDTNYPMEPPENLSVSQAGELLIAFQGVDATPRESVHRILGPPRVASESESIWMYKSITDVNRDWKPHAEMEVLVIRFDPNGLAKDVETDFKTLMKMAEELKNTPTPGE